ncbi:MAG TPA: VCBS repeat-containing protein [Kofleriaceae bacterium]|nr:VCBS repeat-containing protein [Kofleriaceae bacterium]
MARAGLVVVLVGALAAGACGGARGGAGGDGGNGDGDAATGDDAPVAVDASVDASGPPTCTFTPTGNFSPHLECAWNGPAAGAAYPGYDDVVMTPVVMNLTDDDGDGDIDLDDIPDIAFISYRLQEDGCCNVNGVLRVVSGRCQDGAAVEHFAVGPTEIRAATGLNVGLDNSGGLALGDIDSDGLPDIVATLNGGGTIAFTNTGAVKWWNADEPKGADNLAGSQPSIADLDGDGHPEVIQGRVVLNGADGTLEFRGTDGLGTNGFLGPVSSSGDLNLDGTLELLAGNTDYSATGVNWTYPYPTPITSANCQSTGKPCDGFTATGNFDDDAQGEVVIVRAGVIYILNQDGSPLMVNGAPVQIHMPVDDCGKNEGGPPTVADFDGDGEPEIGVAGADYYMVADLECLATPLPAQCSDPGIRWKVPNFDCSSRVTGSSVFDFDGDGRAEVLYEDEQSFRAFDGPTGMIRFSIPNHSHTRLEMPIVADVDNDGNAEIVFVENRNGAGATTQGIRIYGDATDSWAATRRVWNEHAYHITNVSELGAIPAHEPPNWLASNPNTPSGKMNNFRQNLPDFDALAAPDLTVDLHLVLQGCLLIAHVCNHGDVVVGPGVPVHFWDRTSQSEVPCTDAPLSTTDSIAPGACTDVACEWRGAPNPVDARACVDNGGFDCTPAGGNANNECHEDNNRDDAAGPFACTING